MMKYDANEEREEGRDHSSSRLEPFVREQHRGVLPIQVVICNKPSFRDGCDPCTGSQCMKSEWLDLLWGGHPSVRSPCEYATSAQRSERHAQVCVDGSNPHDKRTSIVPGPSHAKPIAPNATSEWTGHPIVSSCEARPAAGTSPQTLINAGRNQCTRYTRADLHTIW